MRIVRIVTVSMFILFVLGCSSAIHTVTEVSDFTNEEQELFNKRYKPNQLQFMPNYPQMYSITGEFTGDGPLPSNY